MKDEESETHGETARLNKLWVWCCYGNVYPIEGGDNRCSGKTNDFMVIKALCYGRLVGQADLDGAKHILVLCQSLKRMHGSSSID